MNGLNAIWSFLFSKKEGYLLGVFLVASVLLWVALLWLLSLLSSRSRKWLVVVVTFLGGLFYALEFFLPDMKGHPGKNILTDYQVPVSNVMRLAGGMTIALGVYGLLRLHGREVMRLRKGWHNSLALLIGLFSMTIFGLLAGVEHPVVWVKRTYDLLFEGFMVNLDASMFSLIAFYIVSASYRAFRIRSVEATILMVTAFLVMLGQIPLGNLLTDSLPTTGWLSAFRVENIKQWVLEIVSSAALRAVGFGLWVGSLAISLRIWLSLERGAYYDGEA